MQTLSAAGVYRETHANAIFHGTNVGTALKFEGEKTRIALCEMVQSVVDFHEMKKTLNVEQVLFTVETLIEDFPAMTLEQWRLACDGMKQGKFGKYFERLKTQEFRDAFLAMEERAAELRERRHEYESKQVTRGADDISKVTYQPTTIEDLRRKKNAPIFALAKHIAELNKNGDTSSNSET